MTSFPSPDYAALPAREQFTRLCDGNPPKDTPIEWVTPGGQIVRGTWSGGAVWFPEGSAMYVYYTLAALAALAPASPAAGKERAE